MTDFNIELWGRERNGTSDSRCWTSNPPRHSSWSIQKVHLCCISIQSKSSFLLSFSSFFHSLLFLLSLLLLYEKFLSPSKWSRQKERMMEGEHHLFQIKIEYFLLHLFFLFLLLSHSLKILPSISISLPPLSTRVLAQRESKNSLSPFESIFSTTSNRERER